MNILNPGHQHSKMMILSAIGPGLQYKIYVFTLTLAHGHFNLKTFKNIPLFQYTQLRITWCCKFMFIFIFILHYLIMLYNT